METRPPLGSLEALSHEVQLVLQQASLMVGVSGCFLLLLEWVGVVSDDIVAHGPLMLNYVLSFVVKWSWWIDCF